MSVIDLFQGKQNTLCYSRLTQMLL